MRLTVLFLALISCTITALADPPTTRPLITASSSIDDILDALDARGKSLHDFSASVSLSSIQNDIGSATTETGKVYYQRKPSGDARIRVDFDHFDDGKTVAPQHHQYTLDNGWLTERNFDKSVEVRRQVSRPGEKTDPLKLGEGSFPLPIGQDKHEVQQMFTVAKIAPAADDPPGTVHLQLTPKPDSTFRKFAAIDVWVDTATAMPRRIQTQENGSPVSKVTDLTNVKINTGLTDKDFALPDVSGWESTSESYNGR